MIEAFVPLSALPPQAAAVGIVEFESLQLATPPFLSVSGCSVLSVSVRQLIPQDLADIPPGPQLAHVLADLELSRLSGFDCVEVLKAQCRQANHERARVLAAMAEVGVCGSVPDDDPTRMRAPDEFAADEIRAALVLTRHPRRRTVALCAHRRARAADSLRDHPGSTHRHAHPLRRLPGHCGATGTRHRAARPCRQRDRAGRLDHRGRRPGPSTRPRHRWRRPVHRRCRPGASPVRRCAATWRFVTGTAP